MAAVFEQLGVKEFLDRLRSLTTEQMRRNRFAGISFFEFTINQGMNGQSATPEPDDDEDELEEEEATAEISPTPTGRGRRRSG
jgi:hypothetical protein